MTRPFIFACLLTLASFGTSAQQSKGAAPSFPGGDSAWHAYCQMALMPYFPFFKKSHIGGDVYVTFIVETDGTVGEINMIKRAGNELDYTIVQMLRASPKWIPATRRGNPEKAQRRDHFSIVPDSIPDINPDSLYLAQKGDTVSTGSKAIAYAEGTTVAGHMINWKRDGWWNFYRRDMVKYGQADYVDGIFLERREYDSKGQLVADYMAPGEDATFPGGDRGWSEFVRKQMVAHMDKLNGTDANGTVEVGFWVDTSGAVGQVTALWPSGTALDNFAIDIVKTSPSWKPATTGGIPVREYRKQRVNFSQPTH